MRKVPAHCVQVLSHNLAIAGGLCEAYELGARRGFDVGAFMEFESDEWHPGCQRPAP